ILQKRVTDVASRTCAVTTVGIDTWPGSGVRVVASIHGGRPEACTLFAAFAVWPAGAVHARQLRGVELSCVASTTSSDGPSPSAFTGQGGRSEYVTSSTTWDAPSTSLSCSPPWSSLPANTKSGAKP